MSNATEKLAALRSALAERQPRDRLGRFAQKAAVKGVELLENPVTRRDLLVNTGGFVSSAVAGALAGPEAALAADLVGALAVRAVVVGRDLVHSAREQIAHRKIYQEANALKKTVLVGKKIFADLKKEHVKEKIDDDTTADVVGWAIGNTAANFLSHTLPSSVAWIPLKGAAVAMPLVPRVVGLKKEIARRAKAKYEAIRSGYPDQN